MAQGGNGVVRTAKRAQTHHSETKKGVPGGHGQRAGPHLARRQAHPLEPASSSTIGRVVKHID